MAQPEPAVDRIEMWGGPECTLNRVGARYFDQIERSGHAGRLDDVDAFASLGITALRYPVLWERIAPDSPSSFDWTWSDARLARISQCGLRPIVGLLHHGSGPRYTSLLDPAFPELFARFAGEVARRYPWVRDYTPINEPLTTARFSALYGHWYPHHRSAQSFVRALLNQVYATVLAMRAIRSVNPAARLIQTEDSGCCFGTAATSEQVRFENRRRWLTWDLLSGLVNRQHALRRYLVANGAVAAELDRLVDEATPPQILGLNYYLTSDRFLDHRLERHPSATHGGNGRLRYADVEAVRARPNGIAGHRAHLLAAWRRYRIPVAITEAHLGCTRDEQLRWLHEAWQEAHAAAAQGARVSAVTSWALLGSFDWDSLVTRSAGHYECGAFDVRAPTPRPTAISALIRDLAAGRRSEHDAIASPGWWRRPHEPVRDRGGSSLPRWQRDWLIVGKRGTLAQACRRVAEHRGLRAILAGRPEADVTDPEALQELFARVRPAAVINTAGYVEVDNAQTESDLCFRINTIGAANVAEACRTHGIPLLTFSSDLVFDGRRNVPYTEDDVPAPLSVYGASKAAAEREVLSLLPEALVVRTSAFFGPWDDANFIARGLQLLRRGEHWRAADDVVVSPTYVPDLVHAAIDLLMDGERGLWHLSNHGSVSWFEFARAAARACGEDVTLVDPIKASDLAWPAPRPAYSALASRRGRIMRGTDAALSEYAEAWRQGAPS
ncbi:MAG TPA: dTDP-4-dehydrorhamnose reductase [Vicinamibacterales bacterium]